MKIGDYLLNLTSKLGAQDLIAVPGDYNLRLLDVIEANSNVTLRSMGNEFGAGHASVSYAMIRGFSTLLTTGGVGETSVLGSFAGAYPVNAPVLHITCWPSEKSQHEYISKHHAIREEADFDFNKYLDMAKDFTIARAVLRKENAVKEINRVVSKMFLHKKPGFIVLPSGLESVDIGHQDVSLVAKSILNQQTSTDKGVTTLVKDLITNAKNPVIVIGQRAMAFDLKNILTAIVNATNIPFATTLASKGAIDENNPLYIGSFFGTIKNEPTVSIIEKSDCVIWFTPDKNDFATQYNSPMNLDKTIEINEDEITINQSASFVIGIESFTRSLFTALVGFKNEFTPVGDIKYKDVQLKSDSKITQEYFFSKLRNFEKDYFKDNGGSLISGIGSYAWPIAFTNLPPKVHYINNVVSWGSLGCGTGFAYGASLATNNARSIAVFGDGDFQENGQTLGEIIRSNLTPVIFLINNHGFSVERVIHGDVGHYNDIPSWDYTAFVQSLTDDKSKLLTIKANNVQQLDDAMQKALVNNDKLVFIELFTDKLDTTSALKDVFQPKKKNKISLYE